MRNCKCSMFSKRVGGIYQIELKACSQNYIRNCISILIQNVKYTYMCDNVGLYLNYLK